MKGVIARHAKTAPLVAALAILGPAAAFADTVPLPPPRPPEVTQPEPEPDKTGSPAAVPLPPPRPPELTQPEPQPDKPGDAAALPEEERACRDRLVQLGAQFTPLPAIDGPGTCGAPHPLQLKTLSSTVTVSGQPVVTCRLAEALATWSRDGLATAPPDKPIASVAVGTSYECRGRNHDAGAQLSEHAFANGVDIAGFTLKDGRGIPVGSDREPALQQALREAACKVFATVLGPGSPGHGEHWHFDMRQRRNDYRICH